MAAAALAETLAVLVSRSAREHGGVPVKWLGDGVMVWFREPAAAVGSALGLVAQLPRPASPAHVGVAAGPVVVQGGDYFGRTVNLAARIAGPCRRRPGPGQQPRGRGAARLSEYAMWRWGQADASRGSPGLGAAAGGRPRPRPPLSDGRAQG